MFYYHNHNTSSTQKYVALRRTERSRGGVDYHHAPARQRELVRSVAQEIIRARRVVVLTGAGLSTASGIRDQSSGMACSNSVKAGPGRAAVAHELGAIARASLNSNGNVQAVAQKRWSLANRLAMAPSNVGSPTEAVPSRGHMALVTLQRAGLVHHVVSTNTDGLHWRR
jgi:NAD-dependent SIR2 family protein deacetylase